MNGISYYLFKSKVTRKIFKNVLLPKFEYINIRNIFVYIYDQLISIIDSK